MSRSAIGRAAARPGRGALRSALLCTLLAGCGSQTTSSSCATPRPDPPAPSALAGAVRASADRARVVPPLGSVTFTVTITGPATAAIPCDSALQLIVIDDADIHVFADTAAAPGGIRCGDLTLASGESVAYSLRWTPETELPPGTYRADLTLGDQPDLVLPVRVGDRPRCG